MLFARKLGVALKKKRKEMLSLQQHHCVDSELSDSRTVLIHFYFFHVQRTMEHKILAVHHDYCKRQRKGNCCY